MMFTKYPLTMALTSVLMTVGMPSSLANPRIASTFADRTYRIERNFIPEYDAVSLLHNLVGYGVPNGVNETFTEESVRATADGGDKEGVKQPHPHEYAASLQQFASHQHDQTSSLVYYLEQLEGAPLERSVDMIGEVAPNSVLQDGGTIHVYLSAPGASALGNHTDTTDIVVVQLDGAKEWLLCSEPLQVHDAGLRLPQDTSTFSKKLNSCSTYSGIEIDTLDCKRTVLHPGDALFLPRRVVHSARALPNQYSAHLTFGFNEDGMCRAASFDPIKQRKTIMERSLHDYEYDEEHDRYYHCDGSGKDCEYFDYYDGHYYQRHYGSYVCDDSCELKCDYSCDESCDYGCDSSCDWSCDKWFFESCDRFCDSSCDRKCDKGCDQSCDCENCD